ncbi:uncharacterized protein BDW43DRAFT_281197 [Aspergillus alliaceus]|uniref:uncharacterized protein n=1 Tax=Petromyces alliaceus TaxID=209559 RepID=UPI0012A527BB|nr:uncharacterized protein BDW43DRAFT_281197 [Aspergillus alliaceus]KAB8231962.1 hypothetical protein BDW43DRAFT_281197 [Aspergillus alliaceus]
MEGDDVGVFCVIISSVLPVQTPPVKFEFIKGVVLKIRSNRRIVVGCRSIGFGYQLEWWGFAEPNWSDVNVRRKGGREKLEERGEMLLFVWVLFCAFSLLTSPDFWSI